MPKGLPKRADEQTLEGGGAGAGAGFGASRTGSSVASQAARNAPKDAASTADEMIRLERKLAMKRELDAAKAKPERQAAERNASVEDSGGVKTTTYPYAGKNEFKNGGKVASASSRADGIAQRGKTRGTIVMCGGGMYKK